MCIEAYANVRGAESDATAYRSSGSECTSSSTERCAPEPEPEPGAEPAASPLAPGCEVAAAACGANASCQRCTTGVPSSVVQMVSRRP